MSEPVPVAPHWVQADFNGYFGDLLCLSHGDTVTAMSGEQIALATGMELVAYEADEEDGQPCALLARGRVEPSPESLSRHGSRWVLRMEPPGVLSWRDLDDATRATLLGR